MNILKFATIALLLATAVTSCNDDDSAPVDEYTLNISGDSNGDFFVDGKSWIAEGSDLNPNDFPPQFRTLKFTVVGDTIVGGVKAKKIQSQLLITGEKSPDYRIGYENNNVIYIWLNNAFRPILDFNIDKDLRIFNRYQDGNISTNAYLYTPWGEWQNFAGKKRKDITIYTGVVQPAAGGSATPTIHHWIDYVGSIQSLNESEFITVLDKNAQPNKFWSYDIIKAVYQADHCMFDLDDYYDRSYALDEPLF